MKEFLNAVGIWFVILVIGALVDVLFGFTLVGRLISYAGIVVAIAYFVIVGGDQNERD